MMFNLEQEQKEMRARWANPDYAALHGTITDKTWIKWKKKFPGVFLDMAGFTMVLEEEQQLMRKRWESRHYREKYGTINRELWAAWQKEFPKSEFVADLLPPWKEE
jgi:hypothetical protein